MESHPKIPETRIKNLALEQPVKDKLANLSIIIPAYNEEKAIGAVLEELCRAPELEDAEILVVDDGSTDATREVVSHFNRARLVQHSTNRGYGASISTGVNVSRGDYILWFDADGQHRLQDLIVVAQTLVEQNLDYCIGSRGSDSYQASDRRLGKFLLAVAVQLAAGSAIRDFNSGLRGFKREVIKKYIHLLPKGFGASTTTSLIMIERGYFGKEVPIVVRNRIGKSSVNQIRDGFRTLMLVLRIFLLFKPMQFFGGIGLFFILIGAMYGFTKAFMNRQGFPVLAALAIIFGIQSVFFGLLADQVSSLRREKFE
jgi:glycosyltransferase involved in cell wall biosynthesis